MSTELALTPLLVATWQTIYMVFISSFIGIIGGLIVGVVLFNTQENGLWKNRSINQVLGFIVNVGRSIPFVILMIAIIPFTRSIVGTTIGTNAAIVPLSLAAIPFYTRIVESAITEVPFGIIEAAIAMGATYWQLISKVLLPEALSSLTKGATLTIVGLIGYSAMAGAVGGGGLGELAINYGYQRFDAVVMLETVIFLVIIVQVVQMLGDYLAKRSRLKAILIATIIFWIVCITSQAWPQTQPSRTIKLGVMAGQEQDIMANAKRVAWQRYHLNIKLIPFDNYTLPNTALNSGDIDANLFQHVPYLNTQIKARGYKIVPIAKTFIYPLGFYSKKVHSLAELPYGALVAIPNDPSNEGRALLLLQKSHLITLRKGVGLLGTPADIVSNLKGLHFVEMNAAQIPRSLHDVTIAALTNDFVKPAGFTVNQALMVEGKDSLYANVIVVQAKDKNRPVFKELVAAIQSKPVLDATMKAFPDGAALQAWK